MNELEEDPPWPLLTWSFRNMSLAMWTILSTWTMEPTLGMSTSANMVSTRMASTSSWRYSGWGTRFRTVSTWTENLISPGVICREPEAGAECFNLRPPPPFWGRQLARVLTSLVVEDGRRKPSMDKP